MSWATDFDGLPGGLVKGLHPVWGDDLPLLLGSDDTAYVLSGYAVAGTAAARRMVAAPGGEASRISITSPWLIKARRI